MNFREWEEVFPPKPKEIPNPENGPTMIRVERHTKYTPDKGLDGGDIFFFDTWEEALEWMKNDYEDSGGLGWNMTRDEKIAHNMEHGVHYKAVMEKGDAESHSEWGY